jgi:hypothetical protein
MKTYAVIQVDHEGEQLIAVFYSRIEAFELANALNEKTSQSDCSYVVQPYAIRTTANQHLKHEQKTKLAKKLTWLRIVNSSLNPVPDFLQKKLMNTVTYFKKRYLWKLKKLKLHKVCVK